MPKFLSTSDVDATNLRSNFVEYLQNQTIFKDYDFEGSNISVLVDLLIQNSMYNNHYLNMIGAESYLDSAELRESIVSRAKELNYVPKSRTSARAVVTVSIAPGDTPNSITIPKGYIFSSTADSKRLNFITNEAHVITRNVSSYELTDITIYEGESVQEFFDVVSTTSNGITSYTSKFNLQSENIDTDSIEVYVTSNNIRKKYKLATSLNNITSTSEVYFLQGYKANNYEIVFGNGVTGIKLYTGDLVEVTYRDTLGVDGNGITGFNFGSSIDGYSDITVVTQVGAYGGSERESNENIKFKAPRHFSTQERAVIASDYTNLVLTNFPEIEAVNSYGGESVNKFGKQIISLKPYNSTIVSEDLQNRIKVFLEEKSLSDEVIIQELDYYYIYIASVIRYNKDETLLSSNQLKSNIVENLVALNSTKFNKFKQNVYSSEISSIIDGSDISIISNSTFLKMSYRFTPTVNVLTSYSIDFENELDLHTTSGEASLEHTPIIKSSEFTYRINDTDYTAWIQDNGNSVLSVYTYNNDNEITFLDDVGTVDYTTGICKFTISIKGYTSYIALFAETKSRDIDVSKNKFIILDSADFDITMKASDA